MPNRTEAHARWATHMGWRKGLDCLAGGRVPDLDLIIHACGNDVPAIRADRQAENRVQLDITYGMEGQAGRCVPEAHGSVLACGSQESAVGAERHAAHDTAQPRDRG